MEIGQMLKEKRAEYQLTQEQLAEKIFVTNKTISNWETGKTTPDIDSLIRLANLFDLSLDNLLLEGSVIVKNIKKQAELKTTKKILLMTFVTNVVFFYIIVSQDTFGELALPVLIALCIGVITNVIAMFYFINKVSKLEERPKSENKKAFILSMFIFLVALGIVYFVKKFN